MEAIVYTTYSTFTSCVLDYNLSSRSFFLSDYISALAPKILPQIPKEPGPDPKTQSMLSAAPRTPWNLVLPFVLLMLLSYLPLQLDYLPVHLAHLSLVY